MSKKAKQLELDAGMKEFIDSLSDLDAMHLLCGGIFSIASRLNTFDVNWKEFYDDLSTLIQTASHIAKARPLDSLQDMVLIFKSRCAGGASN